MEPSTPKPPTLEPPTLAFLFRVYPTCRRRGPVRSGMLGHYRVFIPHASTMSAISPPTTLRSFLTRILSSFESRDFRWLWTANTVNAMGISMDMITLGWLVLEMTDSPFWVGATAGVRGVGSVTFSALGGTLADRLDRRKTLLVVTAARALVVLGLGVLVLTGQIQLWHVVGIAFLSGVTMGLAVPATNALIFDLVGRDLLLNAMAARNAAFNIARIVGGLLVGILISTLGIGVCYLVIAGAFGLGALLLIAVHTEKRTVQSQESIIQNIVGGIAYVSRNRALRTLLILSVLTEAFGFSHFVMLPVVARDVLNTDAYGLGLLSTAGGVGAMVGTFFVASLGDFNRKGRLLFLSCAGTGISLLFFALSPWFVASIFLVALLNVALWAYDSTMGALLQLLTNDEMRGRVLGLYGLTWGFTSLGGFASASIASVAGAPLALAAGAVAMLAYVAGVFKPLSRLDDEIGQVSAGPLPESDGGHSPL